MDAFVGFETSWNLGAKKLVNSSFSLGCFLAMSLNIMFFFSC